MLAICGFITVNAQWGTATANSTTPGGLAGPVSGDADVHLTLYNAIELIPKYNVHFIATFQTVADYNGAAKDMGTREWDVKSTRPGFIAVTLADLQDNAVGGQTIPKSVLTYIVNGGSPAAGNVAIPNVNFPAGINPDVLQLNLKVHPGWGYQGGEYYGGVFVTATQL